MMVWTDTKDQKQDFEQQKEILETNWGLREGERERKEGQSMEEEIS